MRPGQGCSARLAAPLVAPAFARLVDQLDRRLLSGGVHATLPDGTQAPRRLPRAGGGGDRPYPQLAALVRLATSGSVGWYKAWTNREWSSPDPVPLFELFMANALSLGDAARAKGPARWINAAAHACATIARQARHNIAAHYDLGNDFYAAWLDPA